MTEMQSRSAMHVRTATPEDVPSVLNITDGALLQVEISSLKSAIESHAVLVAVTGEEDEERLLGALVLDGSEITALAVRRRRRGQGIGTTLVEAAAERRDELVAEFDERVEAFWQSAGFDVTTLQGSNRYRGRLKP